MQDWLAAAADSAPHALALMTDDQAWTYQQLSKLVDDWCGRLARLGVWAGHKVAVQMPNSADTVCLIYALARLGAKLVPLNTRLTPEETDRQVEQVGVDFRVNAAEEIKQLRPLLSERAPLRLDAVQSIVFTSGTSGAPKGVQITYRNLHAGALASAERLGSAPDDRWLCPLPFYHVGGLSILFRSPLYGSAVVLPSAGSPEAITRALHDSQATVVSLVPTQLYRILEAGFTLPRSLRLILVGGAATAPELIQRCIDKKLPLSLTYGMTETASQIATMPPDGVHRKPGSVGKPLTGTKVRIIDEKGRDLPAGQYGEIVVSGVTVMKGYLGQPLSEGTLHTGDIGYVDADGDLWLVQRRSDLIISGGEKVYPSEVENVLSQHPAVIDVCVVGVADAEWGQRVAAMVALREDAALTEVELLAFSREKLAGYKLPRRLLFVGELPQTASGKVHRQAVQEKLSDISD